MVMVKMEGDRKLPAKSYLVVINPEKPSTWHLPFADESGRPDPQLMGAAWAALTSNYRGKPYGGPKKAEALAKLKKVYETIKRPTPGEVRKEWRAAWADLKEWTPATKEQRSVIDWLVPGPAAAVKEVAAPAPDALHLKIGKSLEKVGVMPTKDIEGRHAEEHGSAWAAPLKNFADVQKALWGMGYRPKGKGIFVRGSVQIDVGQSAKDGKLFLYITDDNAGAEKKG